MIKRNNCPITNQPATTIFSRSYAVPELRPFVDAARHVESLIEKPFEVRFCRSSGLYFQTWVMDDTEASGFYTTPAGDGSFLSKIAELKLHHFAHQTEEILVLRQLIKSKLPRVLDFGCNWGKWASMALAHGCDVYAVEINPNAAAFCAGRGIKTVSRDELRGLTFDFINVDQVMEHLSDPLSTAQELSSCLKPGGYMKWSTPGDSQLPNRLASAQASEDNTILNLKALHSLEPLAHVNLFSNTSLQLLGELVGLRVVGLPFFKWLGAGQLWNISRQFNRNLLNPWKRWRRKGTYLWFQRPTD
jgi:SAM-dependent methyltransferase